MSSALATWLTLIPVSPTSTFRPFSARKPFGGMPPGVDMVAAGTLPTVGMTVYGALRSAGAPWPAAGAAGAAAAGPTVVITAGTGGTGYVAVQLAKALGAARVITAATGAAGIALAKALGADVVVDYKRASVYSAVGAAGADVVLSNHKSNNIAN